MTAKAACDAEGRQGAVYQALQESAGLRVAVKMMRHGPCFNQADRSRFDRKVHICQAL